MDTTHTDPWADWDARMDAYAAEVQAHAADVAESAAGIAAMGALRTASLLSALRCERKYGVTGRAEADAVRVPVTVPGTAPVPVAPPVPVRRVSVREVLRGWLRVERVAVAA